MSCCAQQGARRRIEGRTTPSAAHLLSQQRDGPLCGLVKKGVPSMIIVWIIVWPLLTPSKVPSRPSAHPLSTELLSHWEGNWTVDQVRIRFPARRDI